MPVALLLGDIAQFAADVVFGIFDADGLHLSSPLSIRRMVSRGTPRPIAISGQKGRKAEVIAQSIEDVAVLLVPAVEANFFADQAAADADGIFSCSSDTRAENCPHQAMLTHGRDE